MLTMEKTQIDDESIPTYKQCRLATYMQASAYMILRLYNQNSGTTYIHFVILGRMMTIGNMMQPQGRPQFDCK